MAGDIRAIETEYRGYRFRSRTEARWAVFFDSFGLDWEYEKEGFELPSGRYLPDFWVQWGHCFQAWIEVKGVRPDIFGIENRLCQELANASKQQVLLVVGIPGANPIDQFTPEIVETPKHMRWNGTARLSDFIGDQNRIEYAIEASKAARFEFSDKRR